MSSKYPTVRRSQVITTWGPGALIDLPRQPLGHVLHSPHVLRRPPGLIPGHRLAVTVDDPDRYIGAHDAADDVQRGRILDAGEEMQCLFQSTETLHERRRGLVERKDGRLDDEQLASDAVKFFETEDQMLQEVNESKRECDI